jgi:hypothetical protein
MKSKKSKIRFSQFCVVSPIKKKDENFYRNFKLLQRSMIILKSLSS